MKDSKESTASRVEQKGGARSEGTVATSQISMVELLQGLPVGSGYRSSEDSVEVEQGSTLTRKPYGSKSIKIDVDLVDGLISIDRTRIAQRAPGVFGGVQEEHALAYKWNDFLVAEAVDRRSPQDALRKLVEVSQILLMESGQDNTVLSSSSYRAANQSLEDMNRQLDNLNSTNISDDIKNLAKKGLQIEHQQKALANIKELAKTIITCRNKILGTAHQGGEHHVDATGQESAQISPAIGFFQEISRKTEFNPLNQDIAEKLSDTLHYPFVDNVLSGEKKESMGPVDRAKYRDNHLKRFTSALTESLIFTKSLRDFSDDDMKEIKEEFVSRMVSPTWEDHLIKRFLFDNKDQIDVSRLNNADQYNLAEVEAIEDITYSQDDKDILLNKAKQSLVEKVTRALENDPRTNEQGHLLFSPMHRQVDRSTDGTGAGAGGVGVGERKAARPLNMDRAVNDEEATNTLLEVLGIEIDRRGMVSTEALGVFSDRIAELVKDARNEEEEVINQNAMKKVIRDSREEIKNLEQQEQKGRQ